MIPGVARSSRRGQPLWALGALLAAWICARIALFDVPASIAARPEPAAPAVMGVASPEKQKAPGPSGIAARREDSWVSSLPSRSPPAPLPGHRVWRVLARPVAASPAGIARASVTIPTVPSIGNPSLTQAQRHGEAAPVGAAMAPPEQAREPEHGFRWSGDAWLVWRAGSQALAASGSPAPAYGGSQFGAVLRYDLAPGAAHRPVAYARATGALATAREADVAAGVALRPLPGLPVTAHAEARMSRRGSSLTVRPAAFLSAGVEAPLAAGIVARGYAQAGYVGGRDATGFADGGLVGEVPLLRGREPLLTVGAGAWGGAQRGAARFDVGPSASLRFRLGQGAARLTADYRLRVAGNAEPAAGAALTLSAGF